MADLSTADRVRALLARKPAIYVHAVRETQYGHGLTVFFNNGMRLVLNWSPGSYSANRDVNYVVSPSFRPNPAVVEACVRTASGGFATQEFLPGVAAAGVVAAYVVVDDLRPVFRAIADYELCSHKKQ